MNDTTVPHTGFKRNNGYIAELHDLIERKRAAGMVAMHATFSGGTPQERARELLAMDWEINHGHCHRVRNIDGLIRRRTDMSTMKTTWRINRPGAWILDRLGALRARLRKTWNTIILRKQNPYLGAPVS